MIDEEKHIHLRFYTFCVLLQLRDALRRRTIFVSRSEKWGDLRDKLLSDTAWNRVRVQVCRSLGHETKPDAELRALEKQLDELYRQVNNNLVTSDDVRLEEGVVITGALRDAPYLLECLLEQETHLRPTEVVTDTGGYGDIVFGLFWLLGYQFSPRLADMKDARYWRMNRDTDYGQLNGIARQTVNTQLITEHWDDLLRVAGSLKMGAVKASDLIIRQLLHNASLHTMPA